VNLPPAFSGPDGLLNWGMLATMVVLACALIASRSILVSIILLTVYSLAMAVWMMAMDAPDVALTEAAVGAGVSTLFLLGAWLRTGESVEGRRRALIVPAALSLVIAFGLLATGFVDLPAPGDPLSPAASGAGRAYLERSLAETGIPNVVTSVLASYRGYDTFGETTVIFSAGLGVLLLLSGEPALGAQAVGPGQPVLSAAARLLTPLILLFSLYVLFHGDIGAGGGFQAGVLLAAGLILHGLVFGLEALRGAIPEVVARIGASLGVLLYAAVGVICMLNGGSFLDYDFLFPEGWADPTTGQHFGVLAVEIGVCLCVSAVMLSLFYAFARKGAAQ